VWTKLGVIAFSILPNNSKRSLTDNRLIIVIVSTTTNFLVLNAVEAILSTRFDVGLEFISYFY
jgi:hypothetical protein